MIRRQITALLFLLFTLLLTWQVVNLVRDWTLQNLHRQGSDELLQVITQLRSALDEYRYLPFLISQDADVNDLMLYPVLDKGAEVSLYLEQINLVAGSSSLFVLNADGRALAYSHWRDEQDFFLRSHQTQSYYKQAKQGHRGRQFSLNQETQNPAFFLSSPIYDGQRFTGAAVVRIELNSLVTKLRSNGKILLSDQQGTVFFSTSAFKAYQPLTAKLKQEQVRLSDGITANIWRNGRDNWLVRTVSLDDLDWQVTVLTDTASVQSNVRSAALFAFGGCIALGLLGLLFRERQLKKRSQNETREALARSEAQQKAIINHAQVGLFLVDPKGLITFANEMALQQFAVSMPLILHKPLIDLLVHDQVTPIHRLLSRLDKRGFAPLIGYESVALRGDGTEFPIMVSVRRMSKQPQRQYLVTVIDISRRKALEVALQQSNELLEHKVEERTRELQEAQEELVQAGKMAALGRMSAAVVHELNQPLTAIRNYVAICRQLTQQPEMLADNLALVDELTQRMAQITSQLKTFSYKKPEQVEPVSMQMAVAHALQLFRQRIEAEQVELICDLPQETLYVLGDSARLEQVLVNLIKNALDELTNADIKQLRIELSGTETLTLSVSDTGPGIDPELMPQLFEPFVTSKSIGEGLGLGLAIVKSIMKDLKGDIEARNGDRGACFTIKLPAHKVTASITDEKSDHV